jgi:ABC-type lipoprotein release transport system permease subunit
MNTIRKGRAQMRLITICLRNLSRRKLRTFLGIFGIATATCFIIAVGAVTARYVEIITEMNMFFRGKIIVVPRDAIVIQGFPIGGTFPQSVIYDIEGLEGVKGVTPILFILEFKLGESVSIMPINVTISLPIKEWTLIIDPAMLKPGGYIPPENSTSEVIIGCSIADQYGISTGSRIRLNGKEFNVCGIFDGPSALLGRSVIMDLKEAQDTFGYSMLLNMAVVDAKVGFAQDELASKIEEKVNGVMALTDEERNVLTKPIIDFVGGWNIAIHVTLLFLSMVLTAIVGIMSISERRRDFATLDAIGARSSHIFQIILFENSIIGFIGSVIGIIFGMIVAAFLASFYTTIPLNQSFISIWIITKPIHIIEVMGLVVVSCCFGGVIPAIKASKIRISEILRAEY